MTDERRPRLLDERFLLREAVGEGVAATVWRALDQQTGEVVAIKVLRQEGISLEDVQRLAQEVEILRGLDHPCIVKPHATGLAEGGRPFVAMEWVEGIDLRRKLERTPVLPSGEVGEIVRQIGGALGEAHRHGVVHRDVKPENVLLCAPEHLVVKLVDFGMAKIIRPTAANLTLGEKIFGTPQYMAPERAYGKPVSAAADVYALGILTYEMLTGRRPFEGQSPMEVLTRHIREEPPPTGLDAAVEAVVRRALAKPPEERPGAVEFAEQLAAVL